MGTETVKRSRIGVANFDYGDRYPPNTKAKTMTPAQTAAICDQIKQLKADLETPASEQYKQQVRTRIASLEKRLGF